MKLDEGVYIGELKLDRAIWKISDHLAYLYYDHAEKVRFIDVMLIFLRKTESISLSSTLNMNKLLRTLN